MTKNRPSNAGKKQRTSGHVGGGSAAKKSTKNKNKTKTKNKTKNKNKASSRGCEPNTRQGDDEADALAAMECLRIFQEQRRSWPASQKQFKSFLIEQEGSAGSPYANWFQCHCDREPTLSKRRRRACVRITLQLQKMECLSGTKDSLQWNLDCVAGILAKPKRDTIAQDMVDTLPSPNFRPNGGNSAKESGKVLVILIDSIDLLDSLKALPPFRRNEETGLCDMVAIDCEGVPDNIFIVQVGTDNATYIFDCVKLGARLVCEALAQMLMDADLTKLFHDLHKDASALSEIGGVAPLRGTMDTQLAMEALTGELHVGFDSMLEQLGQQPHPSKRSFKKQMENGDLFAKRPLPPDALKHAADDVSLLIKARESLCSALGDKWDSVQRASDSRALLALQNSGARQLCFDVSNEYAMSSLELLRELRPEAILVPTPLVVSNETDVLLEMLSEDLVIDISERTDELSEIVLDIGRQPHAWINGNRILLGGHDRLVQSSDIESIVNKLGGFGPDNRAGLERQLHRISAVRNRQLDIIGLTMRVGRHVSGNATIISDLLFGDSTKSILFLGSPGSGKTTVIREVTRLLAERSNVCIVDTSNEIAGDGHVPHPCVGFARRMMVKSLDKQAAVMIECVQNHTPDVMVVDEIGRAAEVEAARTCKQRGVRIIASAHGDLRKLIKNPNLRGLIGGVQNVILGDAQAKAEAAKRGGCGGIQKVVAQRSGAPTFDIIVELSRGARNEWRIVLDAGYAVDRVLQREQYPTQLRTHNPLNGSIHLELEKA
jgi:stage III sporulation protein SpoIIIAA